MKKYQIALGFSCKLFLVKNKVIFIIKIIVIHDNYEFLSEIMVNNRKTKDYLETRPHRTLHPTTYSGKYRSAEAI